MMNPAEPLFCFVLQFAAYRFNLGSKKEKDYDKENQGKLGRIYLLTCEFTLHESSLAEPVECVELERPNPLITWNHQ